MELINKRVLVTGGAKRLGAHMAMALASEGMEVLLHYNKSKDEALLVQQKLEKTGARCRLLQADLSSDKARKALLAKLGSKELRPQVLINSASIFPEQGLWDWDEQDLHQNMTLHLTASRDFAGLLRREDDGAIINMLDCRIQDYDSKHVSYHFSKKALYQLTRMLAVEMAPRVRVNAIAPGLILPPKGKGEDYMETMKIYNPLQKAGSPEDIVRAMMFLLQSPFITGQVIYVDGGRNITGSFYG